MKKIRLIEGNKSENKVSWILAVFLSVMTIVVGRDGGCKNRNRKNLTPEAPLRSIWIGLLG